jgi:hypothetical protein
MVPELLRRLQFNLPVAPTGTLQVQSLDGLHAWLPARTPPFTNAMAKLRTGTKPPPLEIAKLEAKPGQELEWIVPPRESDTTPLLIARAPVGLGQVTLVGFDLDVGPFTAWQGQQEFWKRLQEKTRTRPVETMLGQNQYRYSYGELHNDVAGMLDNDLENFPDVSVISFGWVALFILIYILIVGPLDYLFLKKVVKRLELTWITFPTIVLVVSAGAYFAAYALKGDDLKINKIDLVDFDQHSNRSFGTTWFTLFSPRIQLYTIGIEPGFPAAAAGPDTPAPSVVVSWFGRPDPNFGGSNRARSQSLFRRTYEYAPDATGLKGVPIQVWSTKSFTATWERPYAPSQAPFRANLHRRPGFSGVEGSVTNQLPAQLENAYLVVGEGQVDSNIKVYPLGSLKPGETRELGPTVQPVTMGQWVADTTFAGAAYHPAASAPSVATQSLMKRIMFFGVAGQDGMQNSALQYLDQSWRRGHRYEATLVAHVTNQDGPAEAVTDKPDAPSRLWLGQLPTPGAARPPLSGNLVQKTYVRAFLPVRPPPSAGAADKQ